MTFSDETLMAYADGELDPETCRRIEAAMSSDAEIARKIADYRALRAEVSAAFAGVIDEQIPPRLIDAASNAPAGPPPGVADLVARREAKAQSRRWTWREWTSIAASLVLGVLLSRTLMQSSDTEALIAVDGTVVGRSTLSQELSNQVGPSTEPDSQVHIALSYRAQSGEYCRAFTIRAPHAISGIACREDAGWQVRALARSGGDAQEEGYRMAGTPLPTIIVQTVDATMDGEALDPEEEAAVQKRGWR
jgi:hypothetical protein